MKLKFGQISDIDAENGLVRVNFSDDGIVSPWLPVTQPGTQDDKFFRLPDIGELVWCVMDDHSETGVVGGAIYNRQDKPAEGARGKGVTAVKFSDGTVISYDRGASTLKVAIGEAEFTITPAGYTVKRDSETLRAILEDLIDAILKETHATGTGPSGPPLNAPQFQAIKQRLPDLFES